MLGKKLTRHHWQITKLTNYLEVERDFDNLKKNINASQTLHKYTEYIIDQI